jgi:surfeit locus 1 family protein
VTGRRRKRRYLLLLCLSGFALFASLGTWQVERRSWKLDLIARVDARLNAAPVAPPARASKADEYRRVEVSGQFLHAKETLVDALTERGAGSWVMTPLQADDRVIMVNRGFVPPDRRDPSTREAGQVSTPVVVSGLLRLTEPGGRFLRPNVPAQDRWYSRDVEAIGRSRGVKASAPYFIDADASPNPGGFPIGGMTVVRFRNMHLAYALTWFALAAMCLAGAFLAKGGKWMPDEDSNLD